MPFAMDYVIDVAVDKGDGKWGFYSAIVDTGSANLGKLPIPRLNLPRRTRHTNWCNPTRSLVRTDRVKLRLLWNGFERSLCGVL